MKALWKVYEIKKHGKCEFKPGTWKPLVSVGPGAGCGHWLTTEARDTDYGSLAVCSPILSHTFNTSSPGELRLIKDATEKIL